MPATLPPINMSGSVLAGQMSQENTKAESQIFLPDTLSTRFESKREAKQKERRALLRSLQKDLTRVQTAK